MFQSDLVSEGSTINTIMSTVLFDITLTKTSTALFMQQSFKVMLSLCEVCITYNNNKALGYWWVDLVSFTVSSLSLLWTMSLVLGNPLVVPYQVMWNVQWFFCPDPVVRWTLYWEGWWHLALWALFWGVCQLKRCWMTWK